MNWLKYCLADGKLTKNLQERMDTEHHQEGESKLRG